MKYIKKGQQSSRRKFITTNEGCIVITNRKLNPDGYYRVHDRNGVRMYHVQVWEEVNGKRQDGYEIHHKCHNRACCNLQHLELLEGSVHTALSNRERAYEETDRHRQKYRILYEPTSK